ncbi:hypothetical protein I352_02718 [Cryptococcus deuterogattii MMRL2647]|nr:hypothetical protein I352_02718 [Cryptococcus deuterogattii MMRL2647]
MFLSRSQLRLLTLVFLLVTNLHLTNAQIDTSTIAHTIKVTRALYPSSSSSRTDFAKGGVIKIEDSNPTSLSSTPISKTSGMHEARALSMHWVHANPSTLPDQKVRIDAVASPNQEGEYKADPSPTQFSGHKVSVSSQDQGGSLRLAGTVDVSASGDISSADSYDCYEWVWVDEFGNEISKRTNSKSEAMELLVEDREKYEKEKNPSFMGKGAGSGQIGRRATEIVKRAPQAAESPANSTSHESASFSGTSHDPSTNIHPATTSTADSSSAISSTTKAVSSIADSQLTTYPVASVPYSAIEGLHDSQRDPNEFHSFNRAALIASIILIVIGLSAIGYVVVYLYRNKQKKNKEARAKLNQQEQSFAMYNPPRRYDSLKNDNYMYGYDVAHLGNQASSDDSMAPQLNRLYSIQAAFAKNRKVNQPE